MRYEACKACGGEGFNREFNPPRLTTCKSCDGRGQLPAEYIASPLSAIVRDPEGRLIRAATAVAIRQRAKGIEKYNSTLEDQDAYTIGGMIDMVAEELADGSVYVQKVREQYLALLDEIEGHMKWTGSPANSLLQIQKIINRERGNV